LVFEAVFDKLEEAISGEVVEVVMVVAFFTMGMVQFLEKSAIFDQRTFIVFIEAMVIFA
jgi:uncharacterized membrane protein SirB2